MARPSNREMILAAAEGVAATMGVAHLTLETVADAAGITKGGVLYHFPDKESLMAAMMERYLRERATRMERISSAFQQHGDDEARAEIKSVISQNVTVGKKTPVKFHQTLLVAIANDPSLMAPMREYAAFAHGPLIARSKDPQAANLLLLAADGVLLLDLLQISPFRPREREALLTYLLEQADKLDMLPGESLAGAKKGYGMLPDSQSKKKKAP